MGWESLGIHRELSLYESSAVKGEFLAQIELGRIFSGGIEVPRDQQTACKWYALAAEQEGRVEDCPELSEAKAYISEVR